MVLRCPRIAYGSLYPVPPVSWAPDTLHYQSERQNRDSIFVRYFHNFPLEAIAEFGEKLSVAHRLASLPRHSHLARSAVGSTDIDRYLWIEGLHAEEKNPTLHSDVKEFHKKVRNLISDWIDFDIVSSHYAYGYDVLCTQESGRSNSSIFSQKYRAVLTSTFGIQIVDVCLLSKMCWNAFGYPIRSWTTPVKSGT